mmetsp:Transcript_35713/g.100553  ORF Transcript_35713/g.100553 Transcript_35713/m.100553 type:complete len:281 (-) Transcript_35713:1418-2260(-)
MVHGPRARGAQAPRRGGRKAAPRGGYLQSVLPLPRLPELRCLGMRSGTWWSPSPLRAARLRCRCCLSAMICARIFIAGEEMPEPCFLSATADGPRERLRLLELCSLPSTLGRFDPLRPPPASSISSSSSSPGAPRALLRVTDRPRALGCRALARASAAEVSTPMGPSCSRRLLTVCVLSRSAVRGITGLLLAFFFFRRCSSTSVFLRARMRRSCERSSSVRPSPSGRPATSAAHSASCFSSSRSSSASRSSMSGSMKSATLCPLKISGTTSCFHESSSSM